MQYLKKFRIMLIIFSVFCILLTACSLQQSSVETSVFQNTGVYSITKEDKRTIPDDFERIDLNEKEGDIIISDGGDYELSGMLQGQIIVKAEDKMVHLFLNNVVVKSVDTSAVYVESAGKLIITSMPGSVNEFTDAANYIDSEKTSACIYSKSDITINGEGSLSVYGKYKKAIHSGDVVKVIQTNLFAQSNKDAIRGNDGIYIYMSDVKIEAKENCLRTVNIGKNHKGSVEICKTQLSCVSGSYGVVSSDDLYVSSSKVYFNSVLGKIQVDGNTYVEGGNFVDG